MKIALGPVLLGGTMMALVGCAAPQQNAVPTTILSASVAVPGVASDASPTIAPPSVAPEEAEAEAVAPEPEALPTECSSEAPIKNTTACLPPPAFAKKLCGGIYPEVALGMFGKGTPWTRLWLAGNVEAWNASGGLTHRAQLAFDEEVIVLSHHAPGGSGGIVMTGAMASYDVLRWDGTCVSVLEGELTTRRPPAPKPASVPFGRLEETTRRALLASPKVSAAQAALEKACASRSTSAQKKACDKAEKGFTKAVADFVRGGGTLPTPARRP